MHKANGRWVAHVARTIENASCARTGPSRCCASANARTGSAKAGPVCPALALLINPFYPKDPHASFGKHVLTPTLALDQHRRRHPARLDACATGTRTCCKARRRWRPFPQVVGITVHLTFAAPRLRAGRVVPRARREGRARRAACALLPGRVRTARRRAGHRRGRRSSGRASCATSRPAGCEVYRRRYRRPTATTRRRAATCCRAGLPHHHEPDRHPRLSQPLRLLLPGDRRAAHALPGPRRRAGGRATASWL